MSRSRLVISSVLIGVLMTGFVGCQPEPQVPVVPNSSGSPSAPNVGNVGLLTEVKPIAPTNEQNDSLTAFAERLFNELDADAVNPVISPLSVFFALGLTQLGADGATAQEFKDTLGLSAEQTCGIAAQLLADYANIGGGTTLNVANSAWFDPKIAPAQQYIDLVQACFKAEIFQADMQAGGAVDLVNKWVSDKTNNLIPQILNDIDPDTVALLANAIYLKAAWQTPFETFGSYQGEFTKSDGQQVRADFMSTQANPNVLIDSGDVEGVLLPYKDGRLAFMAVIAKQGNDLPPLEPGSIQRWLAAKQDVSKLVLTMPKFKTEYNVTLDKMLRELGFESAFTTGADLSLMGAGKEATLQVAHTVSMEVGEEGTEAAAATIVAVAGSAPMDPPIFVTFDRPYRYALVDTVTGVPLFLGAMNDTSAAPPTVS
ncbi:MAG: hypothetical protein FWG47_04690 [Propionibacteriaceae bacterium]|nr:hypothetical protein [Propionibacteriaceae bacterium]